MITKSLQKKHIIAKQNNLNEIRPKDLALQELRFFAIYLSKINPKDESTRLVRFSLAEFQAIMEIGRIDTKKLRRVTDNLLTKLAGITTETGGVIRFQIFKECRIDMDENGEWYIEIDAHDRALPLMFNLKSHYFKYELWNTLRLKSKNQLRMYEVLKQYEKTGYRIITVKELKEQLGISEDEYPRFGDFKNRVLDSCQQALSKYTDISFLYEPYGKKGRGGKVLELNFTIIKNKDYIDPLSLKGFIGIGDEDANKPNPDFQEIDFDDIDENGIVRATGRHWKYEEHITSLMDACLGEFLREQIIVLLDVMPDYTKQSESTSHDFLQSKYREMDMRKPGQSRFGYLKKLVSEKQD